MYETQCHMAEYTVNVIAECIYCQMDDEGHRYLILDEIVDYMKMDETMEDENIFQISHSGNKHQCHMTRG